jgi:hypothetical protein
VCGGGGVSAKTLAAAPSYWGVGGRDQEHCGLKPALGKIALETLS